MTPRQRSLPCFTSGAAIGELVERDLDVAGDQVDGVLRRAFVRHVVQLDARARREELGREVAHRADARRAVVDAARAALSRTRRNP